MERTPRPLPPTLVVCPWCDLPAELAPDLTSLACRSCSVVVEVTDPDPAPSVQARRPAAAA